MECCVCYSIISNDQNFNKSILKCDHIICQKCIQTFLLRSIPNSNAKSILQCNICKVNYTYIDIISLSPSIISPHTLNNKSIGNLNLLDKNSQACMHHKAINNNNDTKLEYYCKQDNMYLCNICILDKLHTKHDIYHIYELYKENDILDDVKYKKYQEYIKIIYKYKEKYMNMLSNYQYYNNNIIREIEEKYKYIISRLNKHKDNHIYKFQDLTLNINKRIKKRINTFNYIEKLINDIIYQKPQYHNNRQQHGIKHIKRNNTTNDNHNHDHPDHINNHSHSNDNDNNDDNTIDINDKEMIKISELISIEFNKSNKPNNNKKKIESKLNQILNIEIDLSEAPIFEYDNKVVDDFILNYTKIINHDYNKVFKVSQFEKETICKLEDIDIKLKVEEPSNLLKKKLKGCVDKIKGIESDLAILSKLKTEDFKNVLPSNNETNNNNNNSKIKCNIDKNEQLKQYYDPNIKEEPGHNTTNLINNIDLNGICLLGNLNKAIYLSPKTKSIEIVNLTLISDIPNDTKTYTLKNFAACAYISDNKVLYTGGGPSNEVYLLEFKTKSEVRIKALPKMTFSRCWHCVVYLYPYAYIIGGFDGHSRLKHCEKINLLCPIGYESMKPLNEERSLFGCTIYSKKSIFVAGGMISKKNFCTDTIEIYNILEDKWSMINIHLPTKVCGISCLSLENKSKILLFGGTNIYKNYSKIVCEFDMEKYHLRECNFMAKKRQMNNKVFKKDEKIYLIGGSAENDWEIWNEVNEDNEDVFIEKELVSYEKVLKNDLNTFCGFII